METRLYISGALANLATHVEMNFWINGTGILRTLGPLPSRASFVENFGLLIETTRMLANLTCRKETHDITCTEKIFGYLRDVLRYSAQMLRAKEEEPPPEPIYDRIEAEFTEDDEPPLGLRIKWVQPPQLMECLPNTPAALIDPPLAEEDELIEVNGVDVTQMECNLIPPLIDTRPLNMVFRRRVAEKKGFGSDATQALPAGLEMTNIDRVNVYGDRERYLECFHLALLTVHNLSTCTDNHEQLLAEPLVLQLLLELIPSDVLAPTLRRLLFSLLTSLAFQKRVAERIFLAMSKYFETVGTPDASLQKYIMMTANLFYTSSGADEIRPDRKVLIFCGALSSSQAQDEANMAIAEILHGMSRAPRALLEEERFACRETLVMTIQYIDLPDLWGVQARALRWHTS
jgi:hypothetical protein